jgi:hypothetical protein
MQVGSSYLRWGWLAMCDVDNVIHPFIHSTKFYFLFTIDHTIPLMSVLFIVVAVVDKTLPSIFFIGFFVISLHSSKPGFNPIDRSTIQRTPLAAFYKSKTKNHSVYQSIGRD